MAAQKSNLVRGILYFSHLLDVYGIMYEVVMFCVPCPNDCSAFSALSDHEVVWCEWGNVLKSLGTGDQPHANY